MKKDVSPDTAILLQNVKKTFTVRQFPSLTIREKLKSFFIPNPRKKIYALDEINLEIKRGEFFGIIGKNGSGKSTLMNIMSGVYLPDKGGKAIINGRYIKLSLGLGFNIELTARQNIYTNASLLGLSFRQIGRKFDEIVSFAELEAFVDTPVKFYSRGMKTRLGFSIALHAQADIFLLDEVFGGVGDIGFVQKATKAFKESILADKTVILISHSMDVIKANCSRAMLLHNGEQYAVGKTRDIVNAYQYLINTKEKEIENNKKLLNNKNNIS